MEIKIRKIGVIGAGQMGAGIAQVSACADFSVVVCDSKSLSLSTAAKNIEKSLAKLAEKGKCGDVASIMNKISWHDKLDAVADCDLVIEAVNEDEGLKKNVLAAVDALLKKEAIIASNTSSISITRLANATRRTDRFVGMHFMNPVPLMSLVELICGHFTSAHTLATVRSAAEKMGKTCTVAQDYPGFIANRILMPMINEAFFALMEGVASAQDIDTTMKLGCNFPMGPLALADLVGLDTCLAVVKVMHDGLGDDKYRPCPLLVKYVEAGMLGRKTKQGVFSYHE